MGALFSAINLQINVKWIVREADMQNRLIEKYTPSSTRENHHKRLEFLN